MVLAVRQILGFWLCWLLDSVLACCSPDFSAQRTLRFPKGSSVDTFRTVVDRDPVIILSICSHFVIFASVLRFINVIEFVINLLLCCLIAFSFNS